MTMTHIRISILTAKNYGNSFSIQYQNLSIVSYKHNVNEVEIGTRT